MKTMTMMITTTTTAPFKAIINVVVSMIVALVVSSLKILQGLVGDMLDTGTEDGVLSVSSL
jgi:hypothetical protein